jgi:ankyrin repeat protein
VDAGGDFPYAIQAAAYISDEEITTLLIDAGADVNKYGGKWHSAIQASTSAANVDKTTIGRLLLEAGADVNATGGIYGTALQSAYSKGDYCNIWLLYDRGASNSIVGGRWGTALGGAIYDSCQTLVQQCISWHGADVNQPCGKWGTPLHFIVSHRYGDVEELVDACLAAGADINGVGGRWSTPLGAAVWNEKSSLVKRFLEKGADSNLVDETEGRNPLQLASTARNLELVNDLIASGADVNGCTKRGSILQWFARYNSADIIDKLVSYGAEVKAVTRGPFGTALHAACLFGNLEAVKYLLSKGASTTASGGRFNSVLQAAATKADISVTGILLKHKADVNQTGGKYKTALQAACAAGRTKLAKLLLSHGADASITGGLYGSALQAACISGNVRLVRLLLSYKADPRFKGGLYGSALCAAALSGHKKVIKVLLNEDGVSSELLEGYESRFKPQEWTAAAEMIADVTGDEEPLGAFNAGEEIEIPEEDDTGLFVKEETKPEQESSAVISAITNSAGVVIEAPEQIKGEEVVVVEEDMSALDWLQVECGVGGDLY